MRNKIPFIALFVLTFVPLHSVGQQLYVIKAVEPSPIMIGNREVREGDTVRGDHVIHFSVFSQGLKVKALGKEDPSVKIIYSEMYCKSPLTIDNIISSMDNQCPKISDEKIHLITMSGVGDTSIFDTIQPYHFFEGIRDTSRFGNDRRIALVIGNNAYQNKTDKFPRLIKPIINADNIQNKLFQLGFDVMEVRDATAKDMNESINDFFSRAANYQIALIYFSGHGMNDDNVDYLLPIDASASRKMAKKKYQTTAKLASRCRTVAGEAGSVKFIFIYDACRKELEIKSLWDYLKIWKKWEKQEQNKVAFVVEPCKNELFFYAVSSGEESPQGRNDGSPSPFTKTLIESIGVGKDINWEFDLTMKQLRKRNDSYKMNPSLIGRIDFSFSN